MAGKYDYSRAVSRTPASSLDHKRSAAYVRLQDQDLATTGRRRSGVRVLRLGGAKRARRISWRLGPKLKIMGLRFVSQVKAAFQLRKLKDAYVYYFMKADPTEQPDQHICKKYEKAYLAYVRRTVAEGRFYRNGTPILDVKDL